MESRDQGFGFRIHESRLQGFESYKSNDKLTEAPSRGYQGKSEDSEEKDRVKEEVKKKLPTLQTLVIGGHYAPNCKFWCGSTTLRDGMWWCSGVQEDR